MIEQNIYLDNHLNEYLLRRELVACILGSQVRYEMAYTALERIERAGLLNDEWWCNVEDNFETKIFEVLSGKTHQNHDNWCYRFPKTRAHQLATARNAIAKWPLSERLFKNTDPKNIRQRLVMDIAGIGPKQASMFLRNIGISYDLAILDTHVLRFMKMQNIVCQEHMNIATLPAYERTERVVKNYANSLGYPVGYLDWAIWATMRAARELGL
ncbi:hypothetical protein SY88_07515 [Clostridiales bacterium PH28_bin88]|nr:hypothetical protein SY88_07515 [Clostridiales bacterium PH28_bin88]